MLSPAEEIKSRLDIVEVVQGYLRLQKAGANWRGLCPFHSEKTPSFMVSQPKQMWHCFGCGEGGDVFTFVTKIEGLEFADALRILADKAGVILKKQDPQFHSKRKRSYEVCELAAEFFERQLVSRAGQAAVVYLKDRGVSGESIKEFRLGWAPDSWQGLREFLLSEGYSDGEAAEAGLIVRRESDVGPSNTVSAGQPSGRPAPVSREYHDRFRHRIMFPIADGQGQVIGFSGRLFDKIRGRTVHADAGKYINTPNTVLYDKSRILYGLDKAKLAIKEQGGGVLVEGNLDVIMSRQAGVRNVVAPCGTSFTDDHFRIIKRYANRLLLAFDADSAGENALKRSVVSALGHGFEVMVVDTPLGKDAADVVKENPALWRETVAKPRAYLAHILDASLQKHGSATLAAKKAVAGEVLPFIKSIASPLERDHWLNESAARLGVDKAALVDELKKTPVGETVRASADISQSREQGRAGRDGGPSLRQEEYLLALLIRYPELKKHLGSEELGLISDPVLVSALASWSETGAIDQSKFGSFAVLAGEAMLDFVDDAETEFLNVLNGLKRTRLQSKLKAIQADIKKAEAEHDEAVLPSLMREFADLTAKLADLTDKGGRSDRER